MRKFIFNAHLANLHLHNIDVQLLWWSKHTLYNQNIHQSSAAALCTISNVHADDLKDLWCSSTYLAAINTDTNDCKGLYQHA